MKEKTMKKKAISVGAMIIASAIIWGLVIIGCSFKLKGTGCYDEIQNVLVGGFFTHLILIWSPMAAQFAKLKKKKEE
jgi:hypothetical protein